jgi:hypothetical protein
MGSRGVLDEERKSPREAVAVASCDELARPQGQRGAPERAVAAR